MNHWIAFVDEFSFSPQEFYTTFEKQLEAKGIPGLEKARIEFSEGGLLSENRIYYRMLRERLAFDLCAAPFGNSYFFSCRTSVMPPVIRPWHLLVLFIFFGLIFGGLASFLGPIYAGVAVAGLVVAIGQVMQNAWNFGWAEMDTLLMRTSFIGPIYERFFKKETYYRMDTRLVYLELIPRLVKELVQETIATNGVKLSRQYQWAPVLGELYKPLPLPEEKTGA